MNNSFKLAICQMTVKNNKRENIGKASDMIRTAAENNARVIVLPEMFICPYENSKFPEYAEEEKSSYALSIISGLSKEYGIYIFAGSIPELDGSSLFNTCFVFGRDGRIIGKHRKVHLFDINVEGKIKFKESDVLCAGNKITVIDTEFCKIGTAICYDIRFPELFRLMALKGAEVIVVPAAFNMVTGPAHWELLVRTRAVDNQVYLVAASPARNRMSSYIAYGNSMVVDPWGTVIEKAEEEEKIVYADIDLAKVKSIRNELPVLKHRREDIYVVRRACRAGI